MRGGLATRAHKRNSKGSASERGLRALHLELQTLCEFVPNAGPFGAASGAGAFLALRFSPAHPFSCTITESIKHPFETPWTGADTQTGVG